MRRPAPGRLSVRARDRFGNHPDADQFREMCRGRGSARPVHVFEHHVETQVISGIWCWLCSRPIRQDCLSRNNPATLGCRNDDCPLFPPTRLV